MSSTGQAKAGSVKPGMTAYRTIMTRILNLSR
jgi:hypothetical protein